MWYNVIVKKEFVCLQHGSRFLFISKYNKKTKGVKGSYSYHNHPAAETWYSFSAADAAFFIESGEAYSKA